MTKKKKITEEFLAEQDVVQEDQLEDEDEFVDLGLDDSEEDDELETDEDDDEFDDELESEDDDEDQEVFDDDEDDDESEDEDDPYIYKEMLREAKLDEDDYTATVGEVTVERIPQGKFGTPWTKVTIVFNVKNHETGEIVKVNFMANRSFGKQSRLYRIVKGICGKTPIPGFDLRTLTGKKVKVEIELREDDDANVWENVVSARPLKPKKK